MNSKVIIVGAGISGLSCARRLHEAGVESVILEKSRGVGGRCATRRIQGQPVDHGVPFYHGSAPEFLAALRQAAPDATIEGWPKILHGNGRPCQSRSMKPGETRLAFGDGMTVFPKWMARGLDVRLETRVRSVKVVGTRVRVTTDDGDSLDAEALALTLPIPQTQEILQSAEEGVQELRSFTRLLDMTDTVSCLTLMAGYPADNPNLPPWDLCHPHDSEILQICSHDSTKRNRPEFGVLVLHAFPNWARRHFDEEPEIWRDAMLQETARLLGQWAAEPVWCETHRWRYSRVDGGPGMKKPLFLGGNGRPAFGIAGEMFAPDGGVQAAWLSGRRLAGRILGEES